MTTALVYIESDQQLRVSMAEWLRGEGYDVAAFACGAEALDHLDRHVPDGIIANHYIPGRTGLQFLSSLRGRGNNTACLLLHLGRDFELTLHAESLGAECMSLCACGTERFRVLISGFRPAVAYA